jgi:hypothetical protein
VLRTRFSLGLFFNIVYLGCGMWCVVMVVGNLADFAGVRQICEYVQESRDCGGSLCVDYAGCWVGCDDHVYLSGLLWMSLLSHFFPQ